MSHPAKVELEYPSCPLGCSLGDDILLLAHDRLYGQPGEFPVVKCRTCGLIRTNPRPTSETIGFYYPDAYGPHRNTRVDLASQTESSQPRRKRLISRLFQFNTRRVPPLKPGRLLEIGCASGAYMHLMARQGWQVEGIEFAEKPAAAARALGYPVHVGAVETAPGPAEPVDLVVGWMVLEHLHDPIQTLRRLHDWTRPGGWLAISVPNAASLEFGIFKDAWYALQVPPHLFLYTPKTIKEILERGGWRNVKILHQRTLSNLVASIGHVLQDHGHDNRLTHFLLDFPEQYYRLHQFLYPLAFLLSLFGQTGRMTVWAQKEP
jgi:2-polyprenyl-3-methyl-5-hydroxy-6-metoxy-1,4-benzoquinol methylase